MTTITTGTGLGLYGTQISPHSSGSAAAGSGPADQVYVNSATGNLIVQAQDEYLASIGLDLGLVRTYNAQGQVDGDNNDGWRIGVYRSLHSLTGTVNTAGSTVTKVYGDGHEAVFTYDAARGLYVSTDGDGPHDTLAYSSTVQQWTFTDGTPDALETYNSAGKLLGSRDADGNVTSYTYTGGLITRITDASGQTTVLDYVGTNLAQIRTVSSGVQQTRVYYSYDGLNRLSQVTIDLTPGDNTVSDGKTYTSTYVYDGDSTRVASITQGNGTTVSFTYVQVGDQWRVETVTDGEGAITRIDYQAGPVALSATVDTGLLTTVTEPVPPVDYALNLSAAATTEVVTETVTFTLDTAALLTTPGIWRDPAVAATGSVDQPQFAAGSNGTGFAVWRQTDPATGQSRLYAGQYDPALGWQGVTVISTGDPRQQTIAVDAQGNAMAVWVQDNHLHGDGVLLANRYVSGQGWSGPQVISAVDAKNVQAFAFNLASSGDGALIWTKYTYPGEHYTYANCYNAATGWQGAQQVLYQAFTNAATDFQVIQAADEKTEAVWLQNGRIYRATFNPLYQWWSGSGLTNSSAVASNPKLVADVLGNRFIAWNEYDAATGEYSLYCAAFGSDGLGISGRRASNVKPGMQLSLDGQGYGYISSSQYDPNSGKYQATVQRYDFSGQQWSDSWKLSDGDATGVRVAVDRQGNPLAVWEERDASNQTVLLASRWQADSGSWSTPELIGRGAYRDIALYSDGNGDVFLVWVGDDASSGTATVYADRYLGVVGWEGQRILGTGQVTDLHASISPNGDLLVGWTLIDGAGQQAIVSGGYTGAVGNAPALSFTPGTWRDAAVATTGSIDQPQFAAGSNGTGFAIWRQTDPATGQSHLYAGKYDPALGWQEVAAISVGDPIRQSLAVDAQGNVLAVWTEYSPAYGDYVLYSRRYSPSQGWSAQQMLGVGEARAIALSMSPNGEGLLVWNSYDASNDESYTYANAYDPAYGWQGQQYLDYGVGTDIQVVQGADGSATAVWIQDGDVHACYRAASAQWWNWDSLTWGANSSNLNVVVDAQGIALITWNEFDSGSGEYGLYSAAYVADWESWSTHGRIASNVKPGAQLGLDSSGSGYVAFANFDPNSGNSQAYVKRYDFGSRWWSDNWSLGDGDATAIQLAVDSQGNALAVWEERDASNQTVLRASRFEAGGWGWSTPELISSGAHRDINLHNDGHGSVFLVWVSDDAGSATVHADRYLGASGWEGQRVLGTGQVADLQTSISANGDLLVGWTLPDGTGQKTVVSTGYSAGPTSYVIQSGDSWESIAATLYGSTAAAPALKTALNNPALIAGQSLGSPPASMDAEVSRVINIRPYYVVQAGDTWASIASRLYGTVGVDNELSELYPVDLTAGVRLDRLPTVLTDDRILYIPYALDAGAVVGEPSSWQESQVVMPPGSIKDRQLAVDAHGNSLMVWIARDPQTWLRVVYARRYDATLGWQGVELLAETASAFSLRVVVNDSGDAIVTWQDYENGNYQNQALFAKRYLVQGGWQETERLAGNSGYDVQTVLDDVGNVTTMWTTYDYATASYTFNLLRYEAGTGWQLPLVLGQGQVYTNLDVVTLPSGGAIATWRQGASGTSPAALYSLRYDIATGWGEPDLVATSVSDSHLFVDDGGNAVMAWRTTVYQPTYTNQLVVRRYDNVSGWQPPYLVKEGQLSSISYAMDAVGNVYLAYTMPDPNTGYYALFVSRSDGALAWQAPVAIAPVTGSVEDVRVVTDTAGNAMLVWTRIDSDYTTTTIYGSYFNADSGWESPRLIASGPIVDYTNTLSALTVVLDPRGSAIATWKVRDVNTNNDTLVYSTYNALSGWSAAQPIAANLSYDVQVAGDRGGNLLVLRTGYNNGYVTYSDRYIAGWQQYVIQPGDTWEQIALRVYGTEAVADELSAYYGAPVLVAGEYLDNPPPSLIDAFMPTVPVAQYYAVQQGDTWDSIALALYGDAAAGSALAAALGQVSLAPGLHLELPQSLDYTKAFPGRGPASVTDPLGNVTTYAPDAKGRLAEVQSPAVDGVRSSTTYGYDGDGNLASLLSANGEAIALNYDANGNLLVKRDAEGNTVTYTYNSTNQLLTETVYLVADPDGAGPGAPSEPRTTRYVYDAEGHLRFTVSAEGRVRESRYDASGNRLTTIAYRAGVYDLTGLSPTDTLSEAELQAWVGSQDLTQTERSDYAYDFRGQVAAVTTYATIDSTGQGIADGTHSTTRFVYDPAGRLLETIEARGEATADPTDYRTAYTYDGLGRLLTTHQWVSATETRTTLTQYDDANQRLTTTLANGLATTSTYDRVGRLVSVSQADTAQALGTTTYAYDAAGNLRITTDPTGKASHILYDFAGRQVATIDARGSLTESRYDAAGNRIETVAYATRLTPAQRALLTDAQGSPATITLANLNLVASSDDRTNRLVYDAAGRAVLTLDAEGYVTQSFYDGAGQLTDTVTYATAIDTTGLPAGRLTPADLDARIMTSGDDRHTRRFYDDDGILVAVVDAEGYLTENTYNATGQLTVTVAYAAATDIGLRTAGSLEDLKASILMQGANPNDQRTRAFYNGKGERIALLDPEGFLTEFSYDPTGHLTQEVRYATRAAAYSGSETVAQLRPAPSSSDRITQRDYNGAGELIALTELPTGTTTRYTYDDLGRLIQTDRAWNTSEVRTVQAEYDTQGRIMKELGGEGSVALEALLTQNPAATQEEIGAIWVAYGVSHSYDAAGRRSSTTDANGHTTFFYYDETGRLTHTVNALGEVSETRYNAFGEAEATRRYSGRIDTAGLTGGLVNQHFTDRLSAIAGAATDGTQHINYTLRGAVREAIDALGHTTNYSYNAFGELLTQTSPANAPVSYSYDRRGLTLTTTQGERSETVTYDAFGRTIETRDANGNRTVYLYATAQNDDRIGRVVTTTLAAGTAAEATVVQGYDAFGRVLTRTDALNHTTTFSYDDATRRFTVTTPEGIATTTETNAHGETLAITDGKGQTTRYAYDRNGQLITVTQADGSLNLTTTSAYDPSGLKTETRDANGTVTEYQYDAASRLVSRTVDPYDPDTNPEGLNLTTTYSYDGQGRVLTTTDANGTVTATQYDQKGQVTSVTVDPVDPVTNPDGLNLVTTYTYDAKGKTLTVTEGTGTSEARTTEYRYDALGRRVVEIKDPSNSATGYVGLNLTTTYAYDPNGNLIAKTEGEGTAEARTTRYVYDAQNRLTDTVNALGVVSHRAYDASGNLIRTVDYATAIDLTGLATISAADLAARLAASPTDRTTGYAYDSDHRLVYTVNSLGYVTEARYDANGNVITQIAYATAIPTNTATTHTAIAQATSLIANATRDHITRTVYDAANRATFSLDALNQVIERTYDADGNVIKTTAYATAITLPAILTDATVRTAVGLVADASQDRTSRTVYDAAHRAVYGVDALGYVTQTHYDLAGQVRETVAYYDAIDLAALGTNPIPADLDTALAVRSLVQAEKDQHTAYDYDAAGRLTTTTDAEGYREHYQYDAIGNKIAFTNKKGVDAGDQQYTWRYAYDPAGRLIEETTPAVEVTRLTESPDGTITPVTTTEPVVTRIAYDAHGNVIARTEAYGAPEQRTTTYVYDAVGRQTQTIYPPVGVYDADNDAANGGVGRNESAQLLTSTTYYDAFGQAYANKDVNGNVSYKAYDRVGRVQYEVDADRYTTEYSYDAFGNQLTLTRYADPVDHIWSMPQLINAGSGSAYAPQVALDAQGNAMAVWYEQQDYAFSIFGRRYNATTQTWGEAQLIESGTGSAYSPQVAVDEQGNAWVVWSQENTIDGTKSIFANHYIANTQTWDTAQLIETSGGYAGTPQLALDAQGNVMVVWQHTEGTVASVFANRYNASTQTWGTAQIVETGEGSASSSTIALDTEGNGMAVWLQQNGTAFDVYANYYRADIQAWGAAQIIETAVNTAARPQVAMDAEGNALVVQGNYARHYNVASQTWGAAQFIGGGPGSIGHQLIVMDTQGDALVVWNEHQYGGIYRVFSNRYNADTQTWGVAQRLGVGPGEIGPRKFAMDASGRVLAVWQQSDGVKNRIYANHLTALGPTTPVLASQIAASITAQASDRVITNTYDALNRVTETKQPASNVYDSSANAAVGELAYFTAAPATRNEYNAYGQLIRQRSLKNASSGQGSWIDKYSYYDIKGQKTAEIDALGYVTAYEYDARGNLVHQVDYATPLAAGGWDVNGYGEMGAAVLPASLNEAADEVQLIGTGTADDPQIVIDAQGNATAVWQQHDGVTYSIYANHYNASTQTWGVAQLIESNSGAAYFPQIALDAQGNAVAVWKQVDGTANSIYANRYNASAQAWGVAQLIGTAASSTDAVQIALDGQGNAMAVWNNNGVLSANYCNASTQNWGVAQFVVLPGYGYGVTGCPNIVFDSQGNAMAVWNNLNFYLYASRFDASTQAWDVPRYIGGYRLGEARSPQIAVDAQDNIVVVWSQYDTTAYSIYTNRYNASTQHWDANARRIESGAAHADSPQIALDSQGNAMAIWRMGNSIYSSRYNAGKGTWSAEQLIEISTGLAGLPQIAVDVQGNAVALWQVQDGNAIDIYANRYNVSTQSWGVAQLIESGAGYAEKPQIAMDAQGNAMAVWRQRASGTAYSIHARRIGAATGSFAIRDFDRSTRFEYDNLNRKISETKEQVFHSELIDNVPVTGLSDLTTEFTYDAVGNLVSVTDPLGAVTHTYYDSLGRVTAVAEPSRLSESISGFHQAPSLRELDVGLSSTSYNGDLNFTVWTSKKNSDRIKWYYTGHSVSASWSSVAELGDGDVDVTIQYIMQDRWYSPYYGSFTYGATHLQSRSQHYRAGESYTGVSMSWGVYQQEALYVPRIIAVTRVRVTKYVDGRHLVVLDRATNGQENLQLFDKPAIAKTQVELKYYPAGITDPELRAQQTGVVTMESFLKRGGYYAFDVSALPVGQYEYVIAYTMPGDTSPYYTGTGRFNVTETTTVGSTNTVGTVDATNRLVLQGSTAGITGIQIVDGAVLTGIAKVDGSYAIDLRSLPRGHYRYQVMRDGVAESLVSGFDVYTSTMAGELVVQEVPGYFNANGKFVRRIEVANLPVGTTGLTLEYRRAGDTGPYLSKMASPGSSAGLFYLYYDEIPNGVYEYRLKDGTGNLLTVPNSTGTLTIKRGAESTSTQLSASARSLTPLTTIQRDIFGNALHQVRHAGGAATAEEAGCIAALPSADDQHIYTRYDAFGHVLEAVDGEGQSTYYSYNAAGQVAKEWRLQTNADGVSHYVVKRYDYDGTGRQIATTEVLSDGTEARTEVLYDAFGNVVKKGTNGGWQEYYDYDNAGRLWRTNQGDGVDKVYLYNLQGQATAEIRSQGRDLSDRRAYANAAAVAALTSDIVRTDTIYDALGRTVGQVRPSFEVESTPGPDAATVTVENRSVASNFTLERLAYNMFDNWYLSQTETINVSWPPIVEWGDGQVTVSVDYTLSNGSHATRTFNPTTPSATTASTTWNQTNIENYGWPPNVVSIDRVRVSKNVQGRTAVIFDQVGATPAQTNIVLIKQPATVSTQPSLRFRNAGSSAAWTVVPASALLNRGDYYGSDIGVLPIGQYEYVLDYTLPNETTPYYTGTGRFTVSGTSATASVTTVGTVNSANQLVLKGNTTAISGIQIVGGGVLPAILQANGNYVVDLSSLARGHYAYQVIRGEVTDALVSAFDVYTGSVPGNVVVQEMPGFFSDSSTYVRQLQIVNLPATTATVTLRYRHAGDNSAYRSKVAEGAATAGLFALNYDEIPNGIYEYRLVAKDASGNVIDLGAAQTGTVTVGRAGGSPVTAAIQTVTPVLTQTLDRWGNVLTVTDPRNASWVTQYRYNYLNQVIEEIKPEVSVVGEDGVAAQLRPHTRYAYDALGRQIASIDANQFSADGSLKAGYVANGRRYDSAGQLVAEYQADGAVVHYEYDTFGRKIAVGDANGNKSELFYDRNDRVIQSRNGLANSDFYTYDELGNRITVTNALGHTTKYYYDTRGHVIRTVMPELQKHYASYDLWGRKIEESHSGTTDIVRWTYDYFGRLTDHVDLGGADYDYVYNQLGQLLQQTNTRGQNLFYGYYDNGQLRRITDAGTATGDLIANRSETWYAYDAAGNRVRESYAQYNSTTRGYDTYQDAHVLYDALGRMRRYADTTADISYVYDAVGNRRHTQATYTEASGTRTTDYWYLYDAMNRITVSQGELINGKIDITATRGTRLGYDGGSNRRTVDYYDSNGKLVTEYYTYDAVNRLVDTHRLRYEQDPNYPNDPTKLIPVKVYTSQRAYDDAGRVGEYFTYSAPGVLVSRQKNTYNKNGWLLTQANYNKSNVWTSTIDRSAAGAYAYDGRPVSYQVKTPNYTNTYTSTHRAFETYRESSVIGGSTYFQSGQTNFVYDVNGNLVKVSDRTDANKTRTFISNAQGQIVEKTDYQGKHQYYSYANGQAIGSHGDITNADFDFNYTPVSDSYPASSPSSYTVNAGDTLQLVALAVYGDAKLWYLIADANGLSGTSTLTAGQQLTIPNQITNIHNDYQTFKPYNPGEIIGDTTPNLPDPPPPPKKDKGCGVLGMIVMIVVAIVVTIFTAGAALAAIAPGLAASAGGVMAAGTMVLTGGLASGGLLGMAVGFGIGVVAGAAGSIASQLVGMAMGNVQEFSWGAVATSALTAGFGATGALSAVSGAASNALGLGNSGVGQAFVSGVVNNVAGQGINMLTGQQKQFSWASVAVGGLAAAASYGIDKAFNLDPKQELGQFKSFDRSLTGRDFEWGHFSKSLGAELTKSAARQAITIAVNKDGKMDWTQVAADGFGNAIGNAVVDQMKYNDRIEREVKERLDASIDRALADPNNPLYRGSASERGGEVPNFTVGDDGQLRDQNGNLAPYRRAGNEDYGTRNEGTGLVGDVPLGELGSDPVGAPELILPIGMRTSDAQLRLAIAQRSDLRRNTAEIFGHVFLGTDLYATDPFDDIPNARAYGLSPQGLGETVSPVDYLAGPISRGVRVGTTAIFGQTSNELGSMFGAANTEARVIQSYSGNQLEANFIGPRFFEANPSALLDNGSASYANVTGWARQYGLTDTWTSDPLKFPSGGFKFVISDGTTDYAAWGHGVNPSAEALYPGSNAASGPTISITQSPTLGGPKLNLMQDGTWGKFLSDPNAAHIPLINSPF